MSELRFETKKIRVADLGKESCVPDLLGELTMQNSLEFHLDETDEIYEGYGRVKNAYPYRQRNTYTRELKEQEVKTAILENRYLKAVFLPEFGGRLWDSGINIQVEICFTPMMFFSLAIWQCAMRGSAVV